MPEQRLIVHSVALLLLFASGITVTNQAHSAQQRANGAAVSPPKDTVVIDSIGDLPTSTRFKRPGSWGHAIDQHNSVGPAFTLTKATTITEIGAYVEACSVGREVPEGCIPPPPVFVSIHPRLAGKPGLAAPIASYTLSNDNDRVLISYESVNVELRLQPGTYYALFNNPSNKGLLMAGASDPRDYTCGTVFRIKVNRDSDAVSGSSQYIAVRILKEPD
jgi:hypothetical protein